MIFLFSCKLYNLSIALLPLIFTQVHPTNLYQHVGMRSAIAKTSLYLAMKTIKHQILYEFTNMNQ